MPRLDVTKTYKLFIAGDFPRSESGRSLQVHDHSGAAIGHICHASRKDLRSAVEAAASALPGWAGRTAYNRSQILYRMTEMLEGRGDEFARLISRTTGEPLRAARHEVAASIDRLVCFAGWADKFQQVLGCNNPVPSPHYNFTIPEPTGVVAIVCPDVPPLLGMVTLIAPILCAGNTVVVIGSDAHPLSAAIFGEVCATSDVPGGVLNILTGQRAELIDHIAGHREINAVHSANLPAAQTKALQLGAAENLKRVRITQLSADDWYDDDARHGPWAIEPFVELKTIWHPSAV